jgi:hypothetical protein
VGKISSQADDKRNNPIDSAYTDTGIIC